MTKLLDDASLQSALTELNNLPDKTPWQVKDGMLSKTFKFDDFAAAFGWMTQMAIFAEKMNHHPNWSNVYNRVNVQLITHDVGGLTDLDIKLATYMQKNSWGF
jgi:4a-hydroxytetrahydrobiopterin dehydratase